MVNCMAKLVWWSNSTADEEKERGDVSNKNDSYLFMGFFVVVVVVVFFFRKIELLEKYLKEKKNRFLREFFCKKWKLFD